MAVLTAERKADSDLAAVSAGLSLFSYLVAGALHHYTHLRARRSSSTLLFFWLFTIIASFITLRSNIMLRFQITHLPSFILSSISTALQIVVFAAECRRPMDTSGYIRLGEENQLNEVPFV